MGVPLIAGKPLLVGGKPVTLSAPMPLVPSLAGATLPAAFASPTYLGGASAAQANFALDGNGNLLLPTTANKAALFPAFGMISDGTITLTIANGSCYDADIYFLTNAAGTQGYYLNYAGTSDAHAALKDIATNNVLGTPIVVSNTQGVTIKIVLKGSLISILFNGAQVIQYTDTRFGSGLFGLGSDASTGTVVSALSYAQFDSGPAPIIGINPPTLIAGVTAPISGTYGGAPPPSVLVSIDDGSPVPLASFTTGDGRVAAIDNGAWTALFTPPASGTHGFTFSRPDFPSISTTVSLPVATLLPATNLTLAQNQMDNAHWNQVVGTPVVTGISGTKAWSITYENQSALCEYAWGKPYYQVNPATGQITCNGLPSAIDPATGKMTGATEAITVTVTDGVTACIQTFDISITPYFGPTVHVGRGMSTQYPGSGYEHFSDLLIKVCAPIALGDPGGTYATLASNNLLGLTVYVHSDSNPTYYLNDNGGALDSRNPNEIGNSVAGHTNSFGWAGPVKIIGVKGTGGSRPIMGGRSNQECSQIILGKAYLFAEFGDFYMENFELAYCHGYVDPSSSLTATIAGWMLRKDGDTTGGFSIYNCLIHDADFLFDCGHSPHDIHFRYCELYNSGTEYQGSGAGHNLYLNNVHACYIDNVLSYNVINGHTLKTRSKITRVTNSRFFDGERGSASSMGDLCEAGDVSYTNCKFHTGPNFQSCQMIRYGYEDWTDEIPRTNKIAFTNCQFYITAATNNPQNMTALATTPIFTPIGYEPSFTVTDCQFYLYPSGAKETQLVYFDQDGLQAAAWAQMTSPLATLFPGLNVNNIVLSGCTMLTAMPALDFTSPCTGDTPARASWYATHYDGSNPTTWPNYYMVQIDPGADDIRIAADSPAGTPVCTCTAYGADGWNWHAGHASQINPFSTGTAWSIVDSQTLEGQASGGAVDPFAPSGRYAINGSSGVVTYAAPATGPGTDLLWIKAVAGTTTAEHRIYVNRY